ncbi:MAG: BTAD domain-containing putative transcriptional regulator, partial [Chloroflexota bacterium]
AVSQQSHSRESLAAFFWPDADRLRAQANLRNVLSRLKLTLGEEYVLVERPLVSLNTDRLWTDVVEFEQRLGQSQTHHHRPGELCPACLAALTEAADLYRDDFLAGFSLSDSPAFDAWQSAQTERFRLQSAGTMERLVQGYSARGEFETALTYARRWLSLDPLHEPAHASLIQLYAWDGQYVAATRQYEECVRLLKTEIGVAPREETQRLYQAILRREESETAPFLLHPSPLVLNPCPYRSLHAFREEDAALFFGRELFTERLLEGVERQNCAAVVGPSGSGKSSVVQAGLVPRLRVDDRWLLVSFRPGNQPFQALAAALVALLEPDTAESGRLLEATQLAQALSQGLSLQTIGQRLWLNYPGRTRLLLVIDQFEELYTLTPATVRRPFLELLLAAIDYQYPSPPFRFTMTLTLRADFLGQALAFRPLADVLQDSLFILGPMTRQELKRAIENPARRQAIYFQEGLVERILDDVGQEPGNLPLLQFALTLLWESQVGTLVVGTPETWATTPHITHLAYEQIGRVEGALARYADQVYERLSSEQQNQARRIFERMVRPGLGTEHTRSLANRADMSEEDWILVQHLADTRLVVTGRSPAGQEVVEVVHEALLTAWGRLHSWLEQDQEFLLWRHRLQAALGQWEASGRDEGALLRGAPLAEAEAWLGQREEELSAGESLFIVDSVALRQREQVARDAEQAAQARRRQRFTLALAFMFALAVMAAFVAINRQAQAEGERRLAQARELAGRATEAAGRDPELALLLALRAFNVTYSRDGSFVPEARLALNHALLSPYRATLRGHAGEVRSAQFSPDGSLLVTASADGTAILWQMPDGDYLTTLEGHDAPVTSAVFNLDGSRILTTSEDGVARLWQGAVAGSLAESGRPVATLVGQTATFSPDGLWVATGDATGDIRLWQSWDGELVALYEQNQGTAAVSLLAFSPDGARLVSAHADGAAWLWPDLPTLTPTPLSLSGRGAGGEGVGEGTPSPSQGEGRGEGSWAAFIPDGARLVIVSPDGAIRLWHGVEGRLIAELRGEPAAAELPSLP